MTQINWRQTTLINLSVFCLFVIDRVLKIYFKKFSASREFFIFGDWLKLKFTANAGIAFGIPFDFYLLGIIYVAVILFLIFYSVGLYRRGRSGLIFCAALMVAGAASNFLDRLYFGSVIDYIDLKYYSVFNLADAMIFLGVVGLLWDNFKKKTN